mmetsp:Transcript_24974/g.43032  ORF Transcript_24974/g.43032 Transcript_24974/m.43032 type:complete len:257 (-) Transcript_24974:760-1530(-)
MHNCKSSWKTYCAGSVTSKKINSSRNFGFWSCLRCVSVCFHGWRSATPRRNLINGSLRGILSGSSFRLMSNPSMQRMLKRPRDKALPKRESSKCLPMSASAWVANGVCAAAKGGLAAGAGGTNPLSLLLRGACRGCVVEALPRLTIESARFRPDWPPIEDRSLASCAALAAASLRARASSASRSALVLGKGCLSTPKGKGCLTSEAASSSSSELSNSGMSRSRRLTTSTTGAFLTRNKGGSEVGAGGTIFMFLRIS